jgi:DNA-binding response OmpR family regulator
LFQELRRNHSAVGEALDRLGQILRVRTEGYKPVGPAEEDEYHQPVLTAKLTDVRQLHVFHQGKTCFLGNTVAFRFLALLESRLNQYISYEDLLAGVWYGYRADATVRSAVRNLRRKLREAGLSEVAAAIDGSVPGYYALILEHQNPACTAFAPVSPAPRHGASSQCDPRYQPPN